MTYGYLEHTLIVWQRASIPLLGNDDIAQQLGTTPYRTETS